MHESLRTFIAVSVPCPPALRPVVRSLGEMGTAVRPVAADAMHLTLKFLGDTPSERMADLTAAIGEAAVDVPPFEFDLQGIGAFPTRKRPGVVWAGVERGEWLTAIAERLEERLREFGFPQERRPYVPHLTLARVWQKPPQLLHDLFDRHAETAFGTVAVADITLYQSVLSPSGSIYTALSRTRLPVA